MLKLCDGDTLTLQLPDSSTCLAGYPLEYVKHSDGDMLIYRGPRANYIVLSNYMNDVKKDDVERVSKFLADPEEIYKVHQLDELARVYRLADFLGVHALLADLETSIRNRLYMKEWNCADVHAAFAFLPSCLLAFLPSCLQLQQYHLEF
jgi:hypothetical protein